MRTRIGWLLVLLAVALVPGRLWAQSDATLLVTTDLDCSWGLDGHDMGTLKAGDSRVIPASLGKHTMWAYENTEGPNDWRTVVDVGEAGARVEIKLKEVQQTRVADLQQNPTWKDPATRLMWARQDNGRDLNWNQAGDYCRDLTLGGYSNWRLPAIDELPGIFDKTRNVYGDRMKGNITVFGQTVWSRSFGGTLYGMSSGEDWYYVYSYGGSWGHGDPAAARISQSVRVLCVRDTVETVPSGTPRKVRGARGERGSR